MNIAESIGRILYAVSHILLAPIMVSLLALLAGSVYLFGCLLGEWVARFRASHFEIPAVDGRRKSYVRRTRLVEEFLSTATLASDSPADLRRHVRECEATAARRLEGLQVISRLGPVLGLVGTLIPLGPALLSLSTGDVETIAGNAVAFANTIVGLTAGGVAFVLLLIRRRWYAEDLSDIEFLYDVFTEGKPDAVPA